jgi:hypothetical protein
MTENITIKILNFAWGNQDIEILFDDQRFYCSAGYGSSNPLGDLIKFAAMFVHDEDRDSCSTKWDEEPGTMEFTMKRDETDKGILHIDAREYGDFQDPETNKPWTQNDKYHFDVSLETFKTAVIKEALRVLRVYGIRGYDGTWCDGWDTFPIMSLLVLLGVKFTFDDESESYRSNIEDELQLLLSTIKSDQK